MVLQRVEDTLRDFYGSWNTGHTNFVFKLHYLVSFHLLAIFILATSVQLFEKNYVDCVGTKGETEDHIDKFAYYFSTFTTIEDQYGTLKNDMVMHNYYFWVPVLFIYHLFAFRWTYHVWQVRGGRLLRKLSEDRSKAKMFARYIEQRVKYKLNDTFLFQIMFLELQNIFMCVHHWITTNYVLNGNFYQLGLDLSLETLEKLFPYETKFSFTTYGPSGTIQVKDYKCILGLNALYRYIFSFYWLWLVILTILTLLNFVLRIAMMMCRRKIWYWEKNKTTWLLANKNWFLSLRYSDWVFMKYLHEAVTLRKYRAVVKLLANTNMRGMPGEDSSGESSDDDDENEEVREETDEEREIYRDLLRTMMSPVPMITNRDNDDRERSGELRFRARNHGSGTRNLEIIPMPTSSSGHNDNSEPISEVAPDTGTENSGVVLFTTHPIEEQTNADRDPLLDIVPDSETGSSKSENGSERGHLILKGKTVHYRSNKNNKKGM